MASISMSFSSSILPSPIPLDKLRIHHSSPNPILRVIRCALVAPPAKKKRHWKEGEFPAISDTSLPATGKKTPLKNVKKKLDRKLKAKAWVDTVTETLSHRIDKKQWLQALEVCMYFAIFLH